MAGGLSKLASVPSGGGGAAAAAPAAASGGGGGGGGAAAVEEKKEEKEEEEEEDEVRLFGKRKQNFQSKTAGARALAAGLVLLVATGCGWPLSNAGDQKATFAQSAFWPVISRRLVWG